MNAEKTSALEPLRASLLYGEIAVPKICAAHEVSEAYSSVGTGLILARLPETLFRSSGVFTLYPADSKQEKIPDSDAAYERQHSSSS
jgi:hypothetical protein